MTQLAPAPLSAAATCPCTPGQHNLRWQQRRVQGHSCQLAPAVRATGLLSRGTAAPEAQPLSLPPHPVKLRRQLPERQREASLPPFCRANPRAQGRVPLT